jgi:hypothetical protein
MWEVGTDFISRNEIAVNMGNVIEISVLMNNP